MTAPSFVAAIATTSRANGTTRSLALPSGTQAGDLVLLVASVDPNRGLSAPGGWTLVASNAQKAAAWWKVMVAGDITAGTVTVTSDSSSAIMAIGMATYRGTSPAVDASASYLSTPTSSTTLTAPTVTTTAADARVVNLWAVDTTNQDRNLTAQSPLTSRAVGDGIGIGDETYTSAGTTTGRTATTSGNTTWAAFTVALAPPAGPAEITGSLFVVLPGLSADLAGGIEFSGTIDALLPSLGANLAGTSLPPGVAGTLSAILPQLGADLTGLYVLPTASGTLDAALPGLAASIVGSAFEPGVDGIFAAVLPALSASLSGDVLGRTGLGLVLDSSAVLTVDAVLEPEPSVPPGTPPTVLHIIAPTVPVPTLVAGRPQ